MIVSPQTETKEQRDSGHSWAVVTLLGSHQLRRGSWHRVARDDAGAGEVVLDVKGRELPVARGCVGLHAARPLAWTVVEESPPNPHLGSRYGVCPHCTHRMALEGAESLLSCPKCDLTFPVGLSLRWSAGR